MLNRIHTIFMISVLIGFFVPYVSAEDSEGIHESQEYNLLIDAALDQVEKEIEPKEDMMSSADQIQSEGNALKDVKVLDEVILYKEVVDEQTVQTKVIPLLHAEASSIIETLEQMKSSEGVVTFNEEDRTLIIKDESEQLEAMSAFVKRVDILLETKLFQLVHIKPQKIVGDVENILTKNVGQVKFDEQANTIVATDTPSKIGEIAELIEKNDYLNKKILIKAKILQIVLNDEHVDGVDWEAIVSDYQSFSFSKVTEEEPSRKINLGAVSQEDYSILLEALDTVGIVQEISNETIKTENNSKKLVSVLLTGDMQGTDGISKNAQVHFHLTPVINQGNLVTVKITPEFVKKEGSKSSANEDISIQIENGETVVIGSLFNNVMVESSRKIPLLGDLPLLGFVFRNQGEASRKTETITFITVNTVEEEQ